MGSRDVSTGELNRTVMRPRPCVAIVGSDEFRHHWQTALPPGTTIVAVDDPRVTAAHDDRWTSPPIVVLVDDSAGNADATVARMVASAPGAMLVVVSSEMTAQRAEWIERGRVVMLPPTKCGTVFPPLGRCIVEQLAQMVAAQWSRRASRARRPLGTDVWLDEGSRTLVVGARTILLMTGEFIVLRYLSDNLGEWLPTRVVSTEAFGRRDEAGHKLVWKYVSDLRDKLADTPLVIDNARVRGYRLRTTIARTGAVGVSPPTLSPAPERHASSTALSPPPRSDEPSRPRRSRSGRPASPLERPGYHGRPSVPKYSP